MAEVQDQDKETRRKLFPRSARLLKHADFDNVYRNGRRYFSPLMSVFFLDRRTDRAEHGPRIGLTVGRVLGGAVDRNRIKRRIRAMIREHLYCLAPAVDVVMNPKRQVLDAKVKRLSEEVRKAFAAIVKQLDSPQPAETQRNDRPPRRTAKRPQTPGKTHKKSR